MTWNEFVTQVEEFLEKEGLTGDENIFFIDLHLPDEIEEVGYDSVLGIIVS